MASPFVEGEDNKNWLLGIGAAKMVEAGGPGIRLQKDPRLSKE
jgi:hypothetical protein